MLIFYKTSVTILIIKMLTEHCSVASVGTKIKR